MCAPDDTPYRDAGTRFASLAKLARACVSRANIDPLFSRFEDPFEPTLRFQSGRSSRTGR